MPPRSHSIPACGPAAAPGAPSGATPPRAQRRPWVLAIPPALHAELLLSLRAYDPGSGQLLHHGLPRYLRAQVFDDPAAAPEPPPSAASIEHLLRSQELDSYSFFFVRHLLAGCRIVAAYHPEAAVRSYFRDVHDILCVSLLSTAPPAWRRPRAGGRLKEVPDAPP